MAAQELMGRGLAKLLLTPKKPFLNVFLPLLGTLLVAIDLIPLDTDDRNLRTGRIVFWAIKFHGCRNGGTHGRTLR